MLESYADGLGMIAVGQTSLSVTFEVEVRGDTSVTVSCHLTTNKPKTKNPEKNAREAGTPPRDQNLPPFPLR